MDGTLLNSNSELSEKFLEVFEALRKKDIRFAVASGRQYYSLLDKMHFVKEHISFIAENGAIVMENGTEVFLRPMDRQIAHKVIDQVREIGNKHLILCGKEKAYVESTAPEFMGPFLRHYKKYEVVEDLKKVENDVILKITICDLEGAEEKSFPKVKHFQDELQVKVSGKIWVDFNDKEAQKGNALVALQKKHGITKEQTMAFGDYLNDLELFEHAAIGYAVENAHPEVKKAAGNSTKSNDENGVELVLEKLLQEG